MSVLPDSLRRKHDELGFVAVRKERIRSLQGAYDIDRLEFDRFRGEAGFNEYIGRSLGRSIADAAFREGAIRFTTDDDRNEPFVRHRAELTVIITGPLRKDTGG